eukprot:6456991-Amphidinium_carterae.1
MECSGGDMPRPAWRSSLVHQAKPAARDSGVLGEFVHIAAWWPFCLTERKSAAASKCFVHMMGIPVMMRTAICRAMRVVTCLGETSSKALEAKRRRELTQEVDFDVARKAGWNQMFFTMHVLKLPLPVQTLQHSVHEEANHTSWDSTLAIRSTRQLGGFEFVQVFAKKSQGTVFVPPCALYNSTPQDGSAIMPHV